MLQGCAMHHRQLVTRRCLTWLKAWLAMLIDAMTCRSNSLCGTVSLWHRVCARCCMQPAKSLQPAKTLVLAAFGRLVSVGCMVASIVFAEEASLTFLTFRLTRCMDSIMSGMQGCSRLRDTMS